MYRTFLLYQSRSALVHLFKWHSLDFGVWFYFFTTFFFSFLCCHYLLSLVFLGGLSSHLNHLIVSCMTNYEWPFGTLSFGLFGSNLDTRDLETYPRTYSGHFLKYVNFWRFQGCLNTFQKMGGLTKSKFSQWRSDHYPLISLFLGREVPRLNYGPICFPIQNT